MFQLNTFFDLFFLHKSLPTLTREELRDHAFGDCEVFIEYKDKEIGGGYFGGSHSDIWLFEISFKDDLAREIRNQIPIKRVERNDSTGPANFSLGYISPGLTKEAVYEEVFG